MQPIQTTQLDLQFAVQLSPWWLLLLVPLVAAVAYYLYRLQIKGISRGNSLGLMGLRIVLLAGIVFLAFRPSLILRRIFTYPSRIIAVLDDSESMSVRDTGRSDEDALRLSRELAGDQRDQGATYHQLAELLSSAEARLRQFEILQRGMKRDQDAFWDEAEKAQDRIRRHFEEFPELAASAPPVDDESQRRFAAIQEEVGQLSKGLGAFFMGDRAPGRQAFTVYCKQLSSLAAGLYELQAALDRTALAQGNEALRSTVRAIRERTRLDLLKEKLTRSKPSFASLAPHQYLLTSLLLAEKEAPLGELDAKGLQVKPGRTDIVGGIERLLNEESDFPLAALVLFSDGRDLGGRSAEALQQELSRKQVPVYCAAIGSPNEPTDVAILTLVAPPFAVKGAPVRVNVHVKAVLKEPSPVRLEILKGTQVVASEEVVLGARSPDRVTLKFVPRETGLFRYSARFSPAPGEVFPARNNETSFAVHVRDTKVKVLFLDWKPRWETRFALNIFQRMDFIELNSIIAVAQEDAVVKRGVSRGTWPENQAALETYDLVVLGDLPDDLLSPEEWDRLRSLVLDKGKTVCFIGTGKRDPVPAEWAAELLPVRPRSDGSLTDLALSEIEDIALTETGEVHPITRMLARATTQGSDRAQERILRDTQVLLSHRQTGQPVVTCRFAGEGKTLLIDSDQLWRLLNPTLLPAHAGMYIGMVNWAIEGGYSRKSEEKATSPQLGLDLRSLKSGDPVQVWVDGVEGEARVEVISEDGAVLVEAEAGVTREDSAVARAVFNDLPSGNLSFRLKGTQHVSGNVIAIEDNPELKHLSLDAGFLRRLASATGGELREFTDFERFFTQIRPKPRTETHENRWRLWDAANVLAFLIIVLTVEWVWRKLVGLV